MLSAWWTSDGEDARVDPDFSNATVSVISETDMWDRATIVDIDSLYQRDYHYGMNHPREMGYFYLENTDTQQITEAADTSCIGADHIFPEPEAETEIKQLVKGLTTVWRVPFMKASSYDAYALDMYFPANPGGVIGDWTFLLKHFQPYAYYGYPAEVIPSILMHLDIDQDFIDTDSFDDSYDDLSYETHHQPVGYAREIGVSVFESLKEISSHGKEMFGINMRGQVCMPPRITPTATTTALAGVKSLSWRYTTEYQYNDVYITACMASLATLVNRTNPPTELDSGDEVANDAYDFRAEWDATLAGAIGDNWSWSETESLAAQEPRLRLSGTEVVFDGPASSRALPTHMRLYASGAREGARFQAERMEQSVDPLREATVVQDYRGLDYDVGHKVSDVILGDGTVADMRCIYKEIDDDNHTVTSILLEDKSSEGASREGSAFSSAFSSAFGE